jgi:hypothetical protein
MTALRISSILLVAALATSCGKKHSAADVERGRAALSAALESWKNNEPPDRIQSLPDPVDYKDELRLTHRLLEFTVGKPDPTDPEVIRFRVTLKMQDRKGKTIDQEIVYMVALKSPIVIARDPYE